MTRKAIAPVADAGLAAAIRSSERLLARATAHGLAFALDELGDIAIPDPVSSRISKAQLRALAALYLAADLEPAGVIPAVEMLAGLAASGAAALDLGAAEPLIANWWRHRSKKLAANERAAFFSRLFGSAIGATAAEANRNAEFEERMLELCEALYKLDETPGAGPYGDFAHQARIRSAADLLAQNLGAACTGLTAFMAGELVAMLRDAFAILGHADLRHYLGACDVWSVVAGIGRLSHRPQGEPAPYIRRGKAGLAVLAWLADVVDGLGAGSPLVTVDNPVLSAAADWMEATLSLGEKLNGAMPPAPLTGRSALPPSQLPPPADPSWSALGR